MLEVKDPVAIYVLAMGLAVILLLVWLVQRQKTGQGFNLWLASGVVGILFGSVGSFAAVNLAGYRLIKPTTEVPPPAYIPPSNAPQASALAPMVPAGSAGAGGSTGAAGSGGGPGAANPKRDLSSLVRRLDLLTGDIAIQLTPDQSAALIKALAGVDQAEKFSNDEAQKMHDDLLAVLNDKQKARLDAAGALMRRGGPGGGGSGGGRSGAGAGAGPGGGQQDPDANPFKQEANLKALESFRSRFDSTKPAQATEVPAESKE